MHTTVYAYMLVDCIQVYAIKHCEEDRRTDQPDRERSRSVGKRVFGRAMEEVRGMSARPCKYECGTMISWDTATSSFKEQDGTSHTKERCSSLKSLKLEPKATPEQQRQAAIEQAHRENIEASKLLTQAINRLATALEARK